MDVELWCNNDIPLCSNHNIVFVGIIKTHVCMYAHMHKAGIKHKVKWNDFCTWKKGNAKQNELFFWKMYFMVIHEK
jgi:hypothetical protein